MTLETALISALGSVTTALIYAVNLLWARSKANEENIISMRKTIEILIRENGLLTGTLNAFEMCPDKSCPFKPSRAVMSAFLIGSLLFLLSGCNALKRIAENSLKDGGVEITLYRKEW